MKYFILFISFNFCFCSFLSAQVENVKKKSEVQLISNDSICYVNGKPYTGEVIDFQGPKFDKNKLLYDGHFKNGQRNGTIKKWYPNHQLESIEIFNMGNKEGSQYYFYSSGKKKGEENYKMGVKEGAQNTFYENGNKKEEEKYQMGIKQGPQNSFYENGQKKEEAIYANGKLAEHYSFYSPNGKLVKSISFHETLPIVSRAKEFSDDGTLSTEETSRADGSTIIRTYYKNQISEIYYSNNHKKTCEGYYNTSLQKDGEWIFYGDGWINRKYYKNDVEDLIAPYIVKNVNLDYQTSLFKCINAKTGKNEIIQCSVIDNFQNRKSEYNDYYKRLIYRIKELFELYSFSKINSNREFPNDTISQSIRIYINDLDFYPTDQVDMHGSHYNIWSCAVNMTVSINNNKHYELIGEKTIKFRTGPQYSEEGAFNFAFYDAGFPKSKGLIYYDIRNFLKKYFLINKD